MSYLVLLLLLVGVVWLVSGPLRKAARTPGAYADPALESMERLDLEAARDAKYREIRDAELDHETGKLSDDDFAAIDSTLRSEAIELLHELDALEDQSPAG
ncbi:MAG: hypothetical protein FWD04_12930 [Conexibacteraceae bacterium]|nr:hypothetical protein [Conexibacteraceae bacterium]